MGLAEVLQKRIKARKDESGDEVVQENDTLAGASRSSTTSTEYTEVDGENDIQDGVRSLNLFIFYRIHCDYSRKEATTAEQTKKTSVQSPSVPSPKPKKPSGSANDTTTLGQGLSLHSQKSDSATMPAPKPSNAEPAKKIPATSPAPRNTPPPSSPLRRPSPAAAKSSTFPKPRPETRASSP